MPLRTPRFLGRACIQVLGSLSLLVAGLAAATPRVPVDTHVVAARSLIAEESEPPLIVARAETRARQRAELPEEKTEAEIEPSAEPGLEFEGALELKLDSLQNIALGQRRRDDVRFSEQEVQLGLSYRRERFLAFGEIALIGDQTVFADQTPRRSEEGIERGEMWLLFKRIADSGYSVQLGRQNFFEPRLWWWNDDLDAVRFYYARERWRMYLGLAEELGRVSSIQDSIDPEDKDVQRMLGHVGWRASEKFHLGGFLLVQRDHSGTAPLDAVLETVRVDESDADLTWAGLRAAGAIGLSGAGKFFYRADSAFVTGDEDLLELEDNVPGFSRVTGIRQRRVRGWAVDLGAGWELPLRRKPLLKLTYAYGSADEDPNDQTDRSFRQTGLQDKEDDFRDYGVVLRPELSNLRIATLEFGLPVHTGIRLTAAYHYFRQVHAAPFLRSASIDAKTTGQSKAVGDELSLVLQVRKWESLQMDVIGGSFKAGRAYGAAAGERTSRLFFKLIYEF